MPTGQRSAKPLGWGLAFLVLGLMATGLVWSLAKGAEDDRLADRLDAEADQAQSALEARLLGQAQILRGGAGLFFASQEVTRAEFRGFVAQLALNESYPGTQGVGYAVMVAPADLEAHVAAVRAEGFPTYNVTPAGTRDVYSAIVYLEPFVARNLRAFGFDMFQEPVRHAAMVLARDTGQPALSGKVTLVQENGTDPQAGFLLYLPVYRDGATLDTVAQRQAALEGFVYSPLRANDFLQGVFADQSLVDLELHDGENARDEASRLARAGSPHGHHVVERTVAAYGHAWTLRVSPTLDLEASSATGLPSITLGAGSIGSLLLGSLGFLLALRVQVREIQARRQVEMLREQDAFKTQFLRSAAHELGTPLTPIRIQLRLLGDLLRPRNDPAEQKALAVLTRNLDRLKALVQDLLESARLQSGRLRLNVRPMDLRLVLDEVAATFHEPAVQAGIALSVEAPATIPMEADADRLSQVFYNLLSNAVKFTPATGQIQVGVEAHGERVVVRVADTGRGFTAEQAQALFQPFSQVHPGGQQATTGSGLGLHISRGIVEQHGGTLVAASPGPGLGATFTVDLPRRTVAPPAPPVAPIPAAPSLAPP